MHSPFLGGAYRMAMDLVTVREADWFALDQRYHDEMAQKRHLLQTAHGAVFAALPESDAARQEALELLQAVLMTHHPDWFGRDGAAFRNHLTEESWGPSAADPLEVAARLVQEDLCLIQNLPDGPVLTAAALCFPSRWRLAEKIGKPLAAVHQPVPLYADRLAAAVDRFMRHLKPGPVVCRLNWSLLDDPALFQPAPAGGRAITPENAGDGIFLRVERQTLRRLPATLAIVFGIRVHVYPLTRAVDGPGRAAALEQAVRTMPTEVQRYKGILPFRDVLMAWLGTKSARVVT